MPVEATASTVLPSARNREAMIFSVKVFPVPAGASIMKGREGPLLTASTTVLYM